MLSGENGQGKYAVKKGRVRQGLFLLACAATALIWPASAQSGDIPDFMSANFGWLVSSGFDFVPVEGQALPVGRADQSWRGGIGLPANDFNYQPPAAAAEPGRNGPSRYGPWNIERLSDAENPNLTARSAGVMRMHNDLVRNGRRAFSAMSRCWPGGPAQDLFNAEPVYFIQMPREVWIVWQRDHLVRRVFLDRNHGANPKPSWFGESVGHYENGTLVVDTIGFAEHAYSFVDNWRTTHTKDLHMVERWQVLNGGNAIEVTVTFEDPAAFSPAWSGRVRFAKLDGPMVESVCAENNENYGTLLGLSEYPMPEARTPDF